ncbi:invasin domain 3-containing protein [Aliifodinibius salipaludis]|uniref:invasin domain 3-containing protein n=1 Tax=Fodinibius salipaludis TaxID=2032627 RepID=UPI001595D054|nr:invasin domain 3-containing protein [Aliifodinibius salipaludis]
MSIAMMFTAPAFAQNVIPSHDTLSADQVSGSFTTLSGPEIEESTPGQLELNETITLKAPAGYEWDTGGSQPTITIEPNNDFGFTQLDLSFVSRTSTEITFRVDQESGSFFFTPLPGIVIFENMRIRPTKGLLPNKGNIKNMGTTGPAGTTNYGTLTMVAGNAAELAFQRQPSDATVSEPIAPSVQLQLKDQFGNKVETSGISINITLASGTGTISGTLTQTTNSSGIASFSNLEVSQTGLKTIQAVGSGLTSVTSDTFEVLNSGILTKFLITTTEGEPISSQTAGQNFDIRITAVDGANNTISSFDGSVNISSDGSLSEGEGTTANFENGVLSSHSITFSNTGTFALTATETDGSSSGESNDFTVTPGPVDPGNSQITADPTSVQNDGSSTSTITVTLRDANNNRLNTGGNNITLSTTAGSLGSISDNNDGTYTATLTSTTTEETATITGDVNSQAISDDASVIFANIFIWQSASGIFGLGDNWNRAQNWNQNAVPGPGNVVLIPTNPANGNLFPVTDGVDPSVKSLSIEADASITLSNQDTLTIANDLNGEGSVNADPGSYLRIGKDITISDLVLPGTTVSLNGTNSQEIISPLETDTLVIQNSGAGVSASADVTVNNVMNIKNGESLAIDGNTLLVSGDIIGTGSLSGSNSTLRFGGDITTLSSIDASSSEVIFEGSSKQLFNNSMTNIENLIIDNTAGVTTKNNVTVRDQLSLTNGTLTIGSGFSLIANNKNINNGNLRFLREITGNPGWRLLSAPVNSTHGDFLDSLVTQGYPGAFYDSEVAPNDTLQPNVFWYDETQPGTDNERFRTLSSASTPTVSGRGLFVYVFGDVPSDSRYNQALPKTLSISGQEFEGSANKVDLNVTYTAEADTGWNLVGNPYGASIDWNHISWTKTNISNTIYVWDPDANNGNGEYLYWNGVTGTLPDGIIPPFQAFWVKASGSNPQLKVDKSAKTTGGTFYRKESGKQINDTPIIEFMLESGDMKTRSHITFSNSGKKEWDENDGYWLTPLSDTYLELYTILENDSRLSLNNLPRKFGSSIEIPIFIGGFKNGQGISGSALLSWSTNTQIPEGWTLTLTNNKTGKTVDMRNNPFLQTNLSSSKEKKAPNYTYSGNPVTKGKAKNKEENARFTLKISPGSDADDIPEQMKVHQNYPNPFNTSTKIEFGLPQKTEVTIEVFDILGRRVAYLADDKLYPAGFHTITWAPTNLASGVYLYRVRTEEKAITKKMTFIK